MPPPATAISRTTSPELPRNGPSTGRCDHAPADAERPAVDRPAEAELEADVPVEVARLRGPAVAAEIVGAGHHHHLATPQLLGAQARVAQRPDADGDVGALLHQIDERVGEGEDQPHVGQASRKRGRIGIRKCTPKGTEALTRSSPRGPGGAWPRLRSTSSISATSAGDAAAIEARPRA